MKKILFSFIGFSLLLFSVEYKYDELGRLIEARYENNASIHYTYDDAGNILRVWTTGIKVKSNKGIKDDKWDSRYAGDYIQWWRGDFDSTWICSEWTKTGSY